MTLRTETNYEYYFNDASLYYCEAHDCLRVCNDYADSVHLNGVERKDVNDFIEKYIEYVLEQDESTELAKAFKQVTKGKEKSAKGTAS